MNYIFIIYHGLRVSKSRSGKSKYAIDTRLLLASHVQQGIIGITLQKQQEEAMNKHALSR